MGATWDGTGTNFAVFSSLAKAGGGVRLCLFDDRGRETRLTLVERTGDVWHGYAPGVGPGQRYGYRVAGPWEVPRGAMCNGAKLLVDPYALAVDGTADADPSLSGALPGDPFLPDERDSAPHVPRSVVVDRRFDWGDDRPPATPWPDTVVYEAHVRGLTRCHPGVPEHQRGTYAGLASPAVVDHLTGLGVTAVELLPVHHFVSEPGLAERGLTNFWGYSSIGFFAPHGGYSSSGSGGGQVGEFKAMVRALHAAGLEVILDVVYNHTAEGGPDGPTLGLRGLDNPAYYRLDRDDPSRYYDVTGTGNSLNAGHPDALRLVLDSLRYWVAEMHVDGFRFDLAPALSRPRLDFDRHSPFLTMVHQDPVLAGCKLIAEPWDLGPGGYQVGRFPAPWAEWNDRYREGVRDYWRGRSHGRSDLSTRLTGSSDLFRPDEGRRPWASVNFVTAHDGFTLTDLVSFEAKHNQANGEGNTDGTDDNRSWNCGVEGPTTDPAVVGLRHRQRRNLLATLLFSQGVPMLLGGDELGRTQRGNNNAYCQDNEVTWYDWGPSAVDADLLAFVRHCTSLRRRHPVFRRRAFHLDGPPGGMPGDIAWFERHGREMTHDDWASSDERVLGMFLVGRATGEVDEEGQPVMDDDLLLLCNGGALDCAFVLPGPPWAAAYEVLVDTCQPRGVAEGAGPSAGGQPVALPRHSLLLLRGRP